MAYFYRTQERARWGAPSLLFLIYLGVGIGIAAGKNYFQDVDTLKEVVSAVLAVILWPLLLLGINLHVR
jgi:hypothetical protein